MGEFDPLATNETLASFNGDSKAYALYRIALLFGYRDGAEITFDGSCSNDYAFDRAEEAYRLVMESLGQSDS
jgi:hypothetical protein